MQWTTLVSAQALAATAGHPELRIVDARFVLGDAEGGRRAWQTAHLPGAGYADLDRDLSDHRKPAGEGRHPLPGAAAFCATLETLGITPESQVVVYDAAEGAMAAARMWWLLRLLGHRRVAVLDGGFAHWGSLGLALQADSPIIPTGRYLAGFDHSRIAQAPDAQVRVGQVPGWLLDARAAERFRGEVEPIDPVAGHIPGASNRPYTNNLLDGKFKDAEQLRQEFTGLMGCYRPDEVVLSCGSGVTACHNLLAMEHAGLSGARVYAGSWSGWISDRSRPIATGS